MDQRHPGTGPDCRASELLRLLAAWFVEQSAFRILRRCGPRQHAARHFYMKHGAEDLIPLAGLERIKVVLGQR